MFKFDRGKASRIARDTQTAFTTLDRALLSSAQLMCSIIVGKEGADLPESQCQTILLAVHESAGDLLSGRAKMISATRLMNRIQKRSNQAETDFGCPGPGPWSISKTRPAMLAAVA
ncbi:hypothetical protein [Sphingobium phenoxybenzoativorans]|uniref:hypothetical protein n=1 Tax=Sphingobium phenoxybenzoativorans TaxID=1592790 RepID=UPI00087262D5|nr:hypothetical protein [Sphingobium phenoxybenzoativorans]